MAISAGPLFQINPSISFFVNFDPRAPSLMAAEVLDRAHRDEHASRSELQRPSMPARGVPRDRAKRPRIRPSHYCRAGDVVPSLYTGEVCGKAAEARDHYISVFGDAERGQSALYPEGSEPDEPGTTMFSDFRLADSWLAAMDSAQEHHFGFNEAVSLMINCSDQAEIDHYWERLSAVPEAEQCGWLKDRFGVSWQVVRR